MSDICEYENWTYTDGEWDGGVYFCRLPDGHDGPHHCSSVCGFPDPNNTPKEPK